MSDTIKPAHHAWDHRPGGEDPLSFQAPYEIAIANDSVTGSGTGTVSNNTLTTIYFDEVFIATGVISLGAGAASPGTGPIRLKADGWYLFYLDFEWSGTGFTDVRYYDLSFTANADTDGNQDISANESAPFEPSFHRTWGPLYFRGETGATTDVSVKVQHQAGSTQTITGVLLTVAYMGPDLDPTRFPP